MEAGGGDATATSTAVGLCLLPSELLLEILARLALPEILRLRAVSKALESLVSGDFRRIHGGGSWIFLFKKRPPRDAVLRGFNDRAGRWFRFPVAGILSPAVPPGEDLYLLAADGDFFLFACNGRRELVAVNLRTGAVRRIPASPLGPRGTSSWRRPGLKLVAGPSGSDSFRFVFAELHQDRPVLYEYSSGTGAWRSREAVEPRAREQERDAPAAPTDAAAAALLSISHHGSESMVVRAGMMEGGEQEPPVFFRPRFARPGAAEVAESADRLLVYGDGNMAILKSATVSTEETHRVRVRSLMGVELWGMSRDGREWELIARAPKELMERVGGRPYCVMMGCLEGKAGVIRVVIMSNYKGLWDLIWVSYDRAKGEWASVPVPDYGTKGLNMAGIAVTSSLGLYPATSPAVDQ